ncbi:ubiquitin carboxyl-terminal hydrolase 7 [Angomonas deanei]|nr:ubiquitin carboxyl-terminal hydrolase 7 [Angomonas deanei]|eukprot:EPY24372.1 ubiquitin carboxyl-terminal hydrolase 7 [Angomonas deanei]
MGKAIPCSSNEDDNSFYVGLLNQGATCYLNSLMQMLFHLSAFRSIIYQMPTKDEVESCKQEWEGGTGKTKSIPYGLQRLFCSLQTAKSAIGTKDLTSSFGWTDEESFIQHDVHELTRVLIDTLAEKLNQQAGIADSDLQKNQNNVLLRLFSGTLENYVKVDEVDFVGSREEPFYDLQLVVKNKKNIYESFDAFFQVEILDGKNKYCLEQNGEKSYHRAEKGARLKNIPPVLLLHLTRFDYDIMLGETKVCTRWDYYRTLDLSKYMPDSPPEMTHYTLYSVFVHAGTNTGFGHYYCFIHCSGTWYKFNDETVTHATLFEVFGANFGGYRMNYWGTEVPHSSNAYMLVYLRTSAMETLLKPINTSDIPKHVVETLEKEKEEQARLEREKEEDYLYGRVHFVLPSTIKEDARFLSSRLPPGHTFSPNMTLRVSLEADALTEFEAFLRPRLYPDSPDERVWMWFVSTGKGSDRQLLNALVTPGMKVAEVVGKYQECCVLVTDAKTTQVLNTEGGDESKKVYHLLHHKLYDPLQLKIHVLGSTIVYHDPAHDNVRVTLDKVKPHVRQLVSELPDDSKKLYGHHLAGGGSGKPSSSPAPGSLTTVPLREYPTEELTVTWEFETTTLYTSDNDAIHSGDVLVWQLAIKPEDAEYVFYPDVQSYQRDFVARCLPIELKLDQPPGYPTLLKTRLSADMTYEQLQRYVGRLIGVGDQFDRVRFTRHNPETQLPYFMKGKRKDRPTIEKLLTPASSRYTALSTILYYEYCKYTVTEVEEAHSLQFKLFAPNVRMISKHWILLSREQPLEASTVFAACVSAMQVDFQDEEIFSDTTPTTNAADNSVMDELFGESSPPHSPTTLVNGKAEFPVDNDSRSCIVMNKKHITEVVLGFVQFIQSLNPEEAWEHLRLVDVWQGKVYNVFDRDHPFIFEHGSFEESAEYRVELLPSPIRGIPPADQMLIQVHHFSINRNAASATNGNGVGANNGNTNNNNNINNLNGANNVGPNAAPQYGQNLNANKDKVETHSDPFSLYVNLHELPTDFLGRVATKLELEYAAVQDWKVCLVKNLRVVEMSPDVAMGEQLAAFCDASSFEPNQREPVRIAYIGLDHAPLKRHPKTRTDKALILNDHH